MIIIYNFVLDLFWSMYYKLTDDESLINVKEQNEFLMQQSQKSKKVLKINESTAIEEIEKQLMDNTFKSFVDPHYEYSADSIYG